MSKVSLTAQIGDAFHMATLVATFAFAVRVVRHFDKFDASWQEEGFCIAHRDVPYWTSHDACLYFDVAAAAVLALVYYTLHKSQSDLANGEMFRGIPGIVGHGLGHGALGRALRQHATKEVNPWEKGYQHLAGLGSNLERLGYELVFAIFWMSLIKATMPHSSNGAVVAVSLVALFVQAFVPQLYGFTYVQTVLFVVFAWGQLSRPVAEKGFAYALYPIVVGLPVVLVSWMESTQCTAFVKDKLYGHLVYDAYIPLGMLAWYLLCYVHHSHTTTTTAMTTTPHTASKTKLKAV